MDIVEQWTAKYQIVVKDFSNKMIDMMASNKKERIQLLYAGLYEGYRFWYIIFGHERTDLSIHLDVKNHVTYDLLVNKFVFFLNNNIYLIYLIFDLCLNY